MLVGSRLYIISSFYENAAKQKSETRPNISQPQLGLRQREGPRSNILKDQPKFQQRHAGNNSTDDPDLFKPAEDRPIGKQRVQT